MSIAKAKKELRKYASKKKARDLSWFFKTGKGGYGEGDKFIGIIVPNIRKVAKECQDLPLQEAIKLLKSPIHEERLLALLIMVLKFQKAQTEAQKKAVYKAYLTNTKYINNWDLVDLSSHEIIGSFLLKKSKKELYSLSKSESLWERRISIVSTYRFIRNGQLKDTLKIARILLKDSYDLIHKAVGWMLREVGKRDLRALESFLKCHYKSMPRTMLRYSIEKFPENKRLRYLNGKV
ncbi:MAG: DNA alkylation repair protein [Candidatus Omnitrophica bacterium]|nr:DNA alkylation repair protein [Candidatus Omnitrophota bacterium]